MVNEKKDFRSIRIFFGATALLILATFFVPGASAWAKEIPQREKDLAINGPYYKKLVQMKDVVADILPPPAYIIESYLTVLRLIDEAERAMVDGAIDATEMKIINDLIEYGNQLKNGAPGQFPGYFERIDVWSKELPETTAEDKLFKEWLVKKSVEPAKKFYELRDIKFNPLIKAGDIKAAKTVARTDLKPLYQDHRAAVDVVVSRARRVNEKIEKEVADKVSKAEQGQGDVTMADIQVRGDLYKKIIQMKDVVSDILPPPAYIIESYLVVLQLIDETEIGMEDGSIDDKDKVLINGLLESGRQLKEGNSSKGELPGYLERQAFWQADLSDKTPEDKEIKELMTKLSAEQASKFYEVRDSKFTPLVNKGNVEEAKKVAHEELFPLYSEHRKYIDKLVIAANKMYESVDKEVSGLLSGK